MEPRRIVRPDVRRGSAVGELFIDSGKILRYMIGDDDRLDTLITCNPQRLRLTTTDQDMYHAIGSIKEYDNFKMNRLTKFLEAVSIRTVAKKHILTDEIVERLRTEALRN